MSTQGRNLRSSPPKCIHVNGLPSWLAFYVCSLMKRSVARILTTFKPDMQTYHDLRNISRPHRWRLRHWEKFESLSLQRRLGVGWESVTIARLSVRKSKSRETTSPHAKDRSPPLLLHECGSSASSGVLLALTFSGLTNVYFGISLSPLITSRVVVDT